VNDELEKPMSEGREQTSFVQWREREQSDVREEGPRMRIALIVLAIVVALGILATAAVLLLS
jgi:hypothetical protein